MLLMGIFAWIVLAAFVCIYCGNVRDAYRMQKRIEQGRSVLSFREEAAQLLDKSSMSRCSRCRSSVYLSFRSCRFCS